RLPAGNLRGDQHSHSPCWIPSHVLPRKKSSFSLRSKQSETSHVTPSFTVPSGEKPKAAKSVSYQDPRYETLLMTKGSFMGESKLGITNASKSLCQTILKKE